MIIHVVVFALEFIVVVMLAGVLAAYFKGLETIIEKIIGGLYGAGKSVAFSLKDILSKDKNKEDKDE